MEPVRVLVTGAAGFIGSNLVRHLTAHSADDPHVIGIDDLSTGDEANLDGVDLDFRVGSILDAEFLDEAMAGVDAVVHLAARPSVPRSIADPLSSHEVNATGTLMVLEAARRSGDVHVVVASSSSVYGANPTLPKSETMTPMPMSPYAVSKLAAEQYALAAQHSFGMSTLVFRFFNVFGPYQAPDHAYAAVVPNFLAAALRNEPVVIHGDGEQTRDFTYVGTVCEVIADALGRRVVHDQPVNLAFGTRVSLLEVIGLIEGILGTRLERTHTPARVGDVRHSQAATDVLRHLFPSVSPVDLASGLRSTLEWLRMLITP